MPVKDGLAASREILAHYDALGAAAAASGRVAQPPPVIIAMTASAMESDRRQCQQAGMQDFLPKPVNVLTLRQKIEVWAEKVKATRLATPVVATPAAAAGALPVTGTPVPVGGLSPLTAHLLRPRLLANHNK